MRPIPKALDIMGFRWKVQRPWPRALGDNLADTDYERRTIRIARTTAVELAWANLIHEVVEVIDYQTQGSDTQSDEVHQFLDRIDEPLLIFLRDNFGVGT